MRFSHFVIGLGLIANMVLLVHGISAQVCQNSGAQGAGSTSSTGSTTTCQDGTPCGYILTYTPPASSSCVPAMDKCCLDQDQQTYSQPFSCQGEPSHCVGGTKTYRGNVVTVKTTVQCTGGSGQCGALSEY